LGGGLYVQVLHPRGFTLYPCEQGLKHCLYLPGGGLHVHVLHPRQCFSPCQHGYKVDPLGCETCTCNPPPGR
jgi:hypothetical protein